MEEVSSKDEQIFYRVKLLCFGINDEPADSIDNDIVMLPFQPRKCEEIRIQLARQ